MTKEEIQKWIDKLDETMFSSIGDEQFKLLIIQFHNAIIQEAAEMCRKQHNETFTVSWREAVDTCIEAIESQRIKEE